MSSQGSNRYWNAMFQGETGDYVKNLLTDGQWKPSGAGGVDYVKDELAPLWFKVVLTTLLIILAGAVGFGAWKFLMWIL